MEKEITEHLKGIEWQLAMTGRWEECKQVEQARKDLEASRSVRAIAVLKDSQRFQLYLAIYSDASGNEAAAKLNHISNWINYLQSKECVKET